jgi:hypothetical protein
MENVIETKANKIMLLWNQPKITDSQKPAVEQNIGEQVVFLVVITYPNLLVLAVSLRPIAYYRLQLVRISTHKETRTLHNFCKFIRIAYSEGVWTNGAKRCVQSSDTKDHR